MKSLRRTFLKTTAAAGLGAARGVSAAQEHAPEFHTANTGWQAAYDRALSILNANVRVLPRYDKPVLIEGANYAGIWMESGPQEALIYRHFHPQAARNSHQIFFDLQRPDGQLPANHKASETGFGQIQMVVPIAATAWELAQATGDDELLRNAYRACSAWDAWLSRYRNTRGSGLTEGFCTYDTGHDNSPRWAGIPPQCPDKDARRFPPLPTLPRLCPDLSATVYGARVALAAMAKALGQSSDADRWSEDAEKIRQLILAKLYAETDAAFYDLDAQNRFVRIRCDILSRVCGEHVPDARLFDSLWSRQIHNPAAFWPLYPLPSVALDDPLFVRPIPKNSWGGASQALTAMRAGRWLEHYGRPSEFSALMNRWCQAIRADGMFRQQLDPLSGAFSLGEPNYSPTALLLVDFTWRLAGVRQENGALQWNVRPGHAATQSAVFRTRNSAGKNLELRYTSAGAEIRVAGKLVGRVEGRAVRVVTDASGIPQELVGISEQPQKVALQWSGQPRREFLLDPNQHIPLRG